MSSRQQRSLAAASLLALLVLCGPKGAHAQDPSEITLDGIVRAWKQRHREIRSGRFSWTSTRWMRKGLMSEGGYGDGAQYPPEDTTFTYECSLVFDGEKMRFERRGPEWHPQQREFLEEHRIEVWNGQIGKQLDDRQDYPHGYIYGYPFHSTQRNLRAFSHAFRMGHEEWYRFDPAKWVIADRNATVDGRNCILVELSPAVLREKVAAGRRPLKTSIWISPAQNYVVLRSNTTWPERDWTFTECNVEYKRDREHGWYPARWTNTGNAGPMLMDTHDEARVTEYELNIPIDPEQFELEFPDGTVVFDTGTKEEYVWRDGGKRPITREELLRGATYEDVLATDPGQAGLAPRRRTSWITWALWAAAGVVLIAGGAVVCAAGGLESSPLVRADIPL